MVNLYTNVNCAKINFQINLSNLLMIIIYSYYHYYHENVDEDNNHNFNLCNHCIKLCFICGDSMPLESTANNANHNDNDNDNIGNSRNRRKYRNRNNINYFKCKCGLGACHKCTWQSQYRSDVFVQCYTCAIFQQCIFCDVLRSNDCDERESLTYCRECQECEATCDHCNRRS